MKEQPLCSDLIAPISGAEANAMAALSSEGRAEIFAGEIFETGAPSLSRLVSHASHMIDNGFFGLDVETAHQELEPDEYRSRVVALRKAFNEDTGVRHLVGKLLEEWGANSDDAYFDTLKLRIAPPGNETLDFPLAPLAPHRDTWGSNLYEQINVWAPIKALSEDNTMAIWPVLFDNFVPNDSDAWSLDELRVRRSNGQLGDYPLLPTSSATHDIGAAKKLMPDVGQAAIFSGAHLHASVPNTTGRARLNFELRIVYLSDVRAGNAAPNVDGNAPERPLHWFNSLDGMRSLADDAKPLLLA
jgi:hypothetical protein